MGDSLVYDSICTEHRPGPIPEYFRMSRWENIGSCQTLPARSPDRDPREPERNQMSQTIICDSTEEASGNDCWLLSFDAVVCPGSPLSRRSALGRWSISKMHSP
ncbi:hypothetical protein HispidOSU_012597 [Sigmodon hispidus]